MVDSRRTVVIGKDQLDAFKKALVTSIRPGSSEKFIPEFQISIYNKTGQTGFISILDKEFATANFRSDKWSFGFQVPYGLGMWLGELRHQTNLR